MTALKERRIEKGLTQAQAAETIGVTQGYWSKLERALKVNPSGRTLVRIMDTFDLPAKAILTATPDLPVRTRAAS